MKFQPHTPQLLPEAEHPSYASAVVEVLEGLDGQRGGCAMRDASSTPGRRCPAWHSTAAAKAIRTLPSCRPPGRRSRPALSSSSSLTATFMPAFDTPAVQKLAAIDRMHRKLQTERGRQRYTLRRRRWSRSRGRSSRGEGAGSYCCRDWKSAGRVVADLHRAQPAELIRFGGPSHSKSRQPHASAAGLLPERHSTRGTA